MNKNLRKRTAIESKIAPRSKHALHESYAGFFRKLADAQYNGKPSATLEELNF